MVHHTFILPLLAAIIISSHKVVGQQQPTYYPTYWPTYAPTAADDNAAEYGQEKSVQDETTWIDWAKWHADLKAMISGSSSGGGDDEGGNDDNGDKSIDGGWPTYYPTYEPTHYQQTENNDRAVPDDERTLPNSSSSSSSGNNNQGNNGQDNNSSSNNNNNVPSPTYGPTYVPTTYEPTTMEDRTLYYGRQPPKASNPGVYNAYGGVTVTLATAVIVSVTFLFV